VEGGLPAAFEVGLSLVSVAGALEPVLLRGQPNLQSSQQLNQRLTPPSIER
jgi:hypothetical protein